MPDERRVLDAAATPAAALAPHLAHGELNAQETREFEALKALIESRGFRCGNYKERCLRRRIAVRMRARGSHRFADYVDVLEADPTEYQRLLDTITINVSKFFRNAEVWRALEKTVVPRLFELDAPAVRVWSAGCAGGEEPYTLAILLREYAERTGNLRRLDRFRILATDIDRESLAAAARAEYGDFSFTEIDPAVRDRWFEADGPARRLKEEIRSRVEFRPLDLLRSAFPTERHLILCRNVIIYFERSVQEALFTRFRTALAKDGFLLLGKVETMFGIAAPRFRALAHRERIFTAV